MSIACEVDSKNGLLFDMNKSYNYSQNLLCSAKCPCNIAIATQNLTNTTNLTI